MDKFLNIALPIIYVLNLVMSLLFKDYDKKNNALLWAILILILIRTSV